MAAAKLFKSCLRGIEVKNSLVELTPQSQPRAALNGTAQHNGHYPDAPPKPPALQIQPQIIPNELKALPQWVCWKWELRPDSKGVRKWTKPLHNTRNNRYAYSTKPESWTDFEEALAAAPRFDGIGFVFAPDDPYTGVDLDNCIDANGTLASWAAEIVADLDTYTEISPSGSGLKLWVRGELPASGRSKGGQGSDGRGKIEMFSVARYFTVTGHRWESAPGAVHERQKQLTALHERIFAKPTTAKGEATKAAPRVPQILSSADDEQIIRMAGSAKNGAEFSRLWRGGTSGYNDDHSRADAALCSMLAFWTGRDTARMDALFRQSGLMRDKWDKRHRSDGSTYGEMTVAHAAANCSETYSPGAAAAPKSATPRQEPEIQTKGAAAAEFALGEIPAPTLKDAKGNPEYDPATLVELVHPTWDVKNLTTHAAHARRIHDELGDDLCYNANLGWLVYADNYWQRDDKYATRTAARAVTLTDAIRAESAALYSFAASLAKAGRDTDAKAMGAAAAALLRHTKKAESRAFIEGALHLAAGILTVETERFDQKPWIIGFQNGTWDRGQWREHRREDYLLHLSPVVLDFGFDRSEWLAVLDRITAGDADFALMARDVCGYILSAASHLRLLPFFYGPKGTGKSTIAELLQTALGGMAATIDPKKLQDSAARERLGADLWNRRLAVCSEAGSQKLEAELLKTLSGGDRLAVRFLFREAFTAPPRHVLLMVANDPPRMDAYDDALKDRVIALPFIHPLDNGAPLELTGGRRIEAVRQDPASALVRGFAAWALDGLNRVYQTQDIHRAACAQTATAQFWADTDPITPFWETVEEAQLVAGIAKSDLRGRYDEWCKAEGARPLNRNRWTKACEAHGLADQKRTGGTRFWSLEKTQKPKLVAQVAQLSCFSKDTREDDKMPHGQFEKDLSCATCATLAEGYDPFESDDE
jgi:putative DNA primase/helicase